MTLLPYNLKTEYIEDILIELEKCLELKKPPASGKHCANCFWQHEVSQFSK